MNTVIYLIRHGEVDNPLQVVYASSVDVKLSKTGMEQLERLGILLKRQGVVPGVILASPLTRAKQSAVQLAKLFPNARIVFDKRLQDVKAPGVEKFSISWLDAFEEDVYYRTGDELTGIVFEQPDEQAKRIISVIYEALDQYRGQKVFIVSHGDPTAFALWRLNNAEGDIKDIAKRSVKQKKYLGRGEAWRLVFNIDKKVVEEEHIKQPIIL